MENRTRRRSCALSGPSAVRGYRMSEVDALLDRLAAEREPRHEPRPSQQPGEQPGDQAPPADGAGA